MEIPYIFTPRKDTGLVNSKIAIWLFLASEVMLFGGFFSAYVFLRLGADYPWPERTLPVLPGLINTFVLIGSSVTVVFAWAALKMREWRKFQIFMGITIACAAIFMVLKGVEYYGKFHHQAVRLNDYTIIEGHLGYEKEKDYLGHEVEENQIIVEAEKLTFSTVRFHKPWVKSLIGQAAHRGAKIRLSENIEAVVKDSPRGQDGMPKKKLLAKAGDELTVKLVDQLQALHLDARAHNGSLRVSALRQEWKKARAEFPDGKSYELAEKVNFDVAALEPKFYSEISTVGCNVEPPAHFVFAPRDIREGATQSRLRDDTVIEGKMLDSPMVFHSADAIDFQFLVMKSSEKGIDPVTAIEDSWIIKNNAFVREAWEWHKGETAKLSEHLIQKYKIDEKTGKPNREPTPKELYRIGWKELAKFGEERHHVKLTGTEKLMEEFRGPNYDARNHMEGAGEHENATFPEISVPRQQIGFASKFTPSWNTYYAIYFTMTGLHGLHVIGGAIVLSYYLFFGRKMYLSNPEWLANRVEVGGLFWHFVDLVWIFVFPVLYLM